MAHAHHFTEHIHTGAFGESLAGKKAHLPGTYERVDAVHAERLNTHQHFARAGGGHGNLVDGEHVRRTVFGVLYSAHGGWQGHSCSIYSLFW